MTNVTALLLHIIKLNLTHAMNHNNYQFCKARSQKSLAPRE